MSVFTSRVTKFLEIPHDPGQSVTIRQLSPRHLDQAQKQSRLQAIAELKEMGGAAFMRELQALGGDAAVQSAVAADPLVLFDRAVLLEKGITAWSYDQPLNREAFDDLNEQTLTFLAREILRLAKPSLFQTEDEQEAARKNAASGSIAV